jgi:hypothetical protein
LICDTPARPKSALRQGKTATRRQGENGHFRVNLAKNGVICLKTARKIARRAGRKSDFKGQRVSFDLFCSNKYFGLLEQKPCVRHQKRGFALIITLNYESKLQGVS